MMICIQIVYIYIYIYTLAYVKLLGMEKISIP